jgi:hypothetical protein
MKKEECRMKNVSAKLGCLVSSFFILHSSFGTNND